VFVREDGEAATASALLVGHHHRLNRRDQFATMVAFAIWLISLTLEAPRAWSLTIDAMDTDQRKSHKM